jgi:delta24-sterol reductase
MKRLSIVQKYYLVMQAWFFFWISIAIFFMDLLTGKSTELEIADDAAEAHKKRVDYVVQQVANAKFPLFTNKPHWQRVSSRIVENRPGTGIDLSALNNIVAVDYEKGTITLEPGVRMVELSHFLEKGNQILPSIPELDDLTVSGLLMGCGIESTGFKYGMFNECVIAYEILMADRKVHRITKDDSDIFYSLPWSYGTLGLLLSVELKLVSSEPYVRLNMQHVNSRQELCKVLTEATKRTDIEFLEALAFSQTHAVVMTGTYAKAPASEDASMHLSGMTGKWFYEEVKNCRSKTVVMKTTDYLHRHSKGIFWELSYLLPFGNTTLFRWLFGWLTPPKIALTKRFQPKFTLEWYSGNHVVQDYLIPMDKLHECMDLCDDELGVYPIWLCPYVNKKHPADGLMHPHGSNDKMYIDVGYYGLPSPKTNPIWLNCDMLSLCQKVESWMLKNQGFVMLYAFHGLDQTTIREMFCHTTYDKVRAKYDKEDVNMYPSILEKVGKIKPKAAIGNGKVNGNHGKAD